MRFTLFQRIILWFLLNLAILAVVFLGYMNIRLRLPADSLLAGSMGERFQVLPYVVGRELSEHPPWQWNALVQAQSRRLGVGIHLLLEDGHLVSAGSGELPAAVRARADSYMAEHRQQRGRMGAGPPQAPRPPMVMPPGRPALGPGGPPGAAGPEALPGGLPEALARRPQPFTLKAGDPELHWAGLPILISPRGSRQQWHGVLLVSSDSLTGHGLFFDPVPWLVSIAAALAFSALWWWPMIRGITRPLARITSATEQIARGSFDISLPQGRGDEIGRLSQAINQMAARLKALVGGHKQFMSSVAHELTSPVARIQLGLGLLERELGPEHQERLLSVMDDADHMSRLLDELLSFSRAELGPEKVELADLELEPLVQTAWHREQQPGVELEVDIPPGLAVRADAKLLLRALGNLLRNAVRHAGLAGPITVSAAHREGRVELSVRDHGPGVPEAELPRIFEPFHQAGNRPPGGGGVGMGLAIVKSCMESCGGEATVRNHPQGGLEASLWLNPAQGARA